MSWGIVYHKAGDGTVPADQFLDSCPDKVEATIYAVLEAARLAPPSSSAAGRWEAMHGSVRVLGEDYLANLPRRIAS